MNIHKQEVLEILDTLPDVFDAEELQFPLFLLEKIKQAEEDIDKGYIVSNLDLSERIKLCLEK